MSGGGTWRRGAAMLLACCLLLPAGGQAGAAAPHKKKHTPATEAAPDDADEAAASPSPASKRHHKQPAPDKNDDEPAAAATASPAAAKTEAGFHHAAVAADDAGTKQSPPAQPAATSSLDPSELRDFESLPEPVRKLLSSALALTKANLTYTYGSADPANGGMDCSGTVYHLLQELGFKDVPRSASEQYAWVRRQSTFYAVLSKKDDTFELNEMRPGDLLFWTGTYQVEHDPPVTHAMIYLGHRSKDGKAVMMGASDGRSYDGEKRNGVSVFDFKLPAARSGDKTDAATAAAPDHSPDFAGYGPIPGMAERNDAANRQAKAK